MTLRSVTEHEVPAINLSTLLMSCESPWSSTNGLDGSWGRIYYHWSYQDSEMWIELM